MKKISVCIVTYNNENNILSVLKCIYKYSKNFFIDTFVVDNNSLDNTVKLVKDNFPQVNLIRLSKNKGFSFAHNQVLNKINSDFHVILNPDITFCTNIFDELSSYMQENLDVVAVVPQILNEDGSIQDLPRRFPKIKYLISGRLENLGKIFKNWRDEYTCKKKCFNLPTEIDFCSGCFIMIKTDIFKKLNGFDEQFFMYFEDADLTRRAKKYGKTILNPNFYVTHVWQRDSSKKFKYLCIHFISMIKYFKKWNKKGDSLK